jgi:Icc-related predicted phosphoesterase
MKVAIASDLHLEFHDMLLDNPGADVLVLAGDILNARALYRFPDGQDPSGQSPVMAGNAQRFIKFIERASSQFKYVVVVAGNHEFYDFRFHQGLDVLIEFYARYPNVHFLEDGCITLDGQQFIGGTLWTDMNKMDALTLYHTKDCMNDYRLITDDSKGYTKLRPAHTVSRHRTSVQYLKAMIQQDAFVVTHHAPSFASIHDYYKDDFLLNGAYASDLSDMILDSKIKYWVHGHIHQAKDYMIGDTRIICNPRGYPNEIPFELKVIEL